VPDEKLIDKDPKRTCERFNCISKFAYATSKGFQPGNPKK